MLLGFSTIYYFPSDPVHVPGFSCHDAGVVEQDPMARVSVVLCQGAIFSCVNVDVKDGVVVCLSLHG
jgi:hypothetical protein